MKLLILLGAVVVLHFPVAAFTLYDNTGFKNKPDLSVYAIKKIHILYENYFWPASDTMRDHPNEALTRQCARNSFGLSDDDFVVVDIERWPYDVRRKGLDTVMANIAKLAQVTDWLKDEMPDLKFGHYAVIPLRDYWTPVNNNATTMEQWRFANNLLSPIANSVDALFSSLYTFYKDTTGWKTYAIENVKEARRVAPGKPIYPYIWPLYHEGGDQSLRGTYLDSAFWACQLNTLYNAGTDGAVIWAAGNEWDSTQGWWKATKAFINLHGMTSYTRPVVEAGSNQALAMGELTTTLNASYSDIVPVANPTVKWFGNAVFSHPQSLQTAVTFSRPGKYKLYVEVKDGHVKGLDFRQVTVPSMEPYARYSFDAFKGDSIIDSSGNGLWGTKVKTTLTSDKSGTALQFRNLDSSTASIYDAAALNMDNFEFSVAGWAYFDSLAPHMYFVSKGPVGQCCAANGYPGYLLGVYNGRLAFRIEDEAAGINSVHIGAKTAPSCSTWTHVAGVRRGIKTLLYVNGQVVDSATISSPETYSINNNYQVSLGHRLNGKLDEVQFYNRALTAQEVANLFNGDIPRTSISLPVPEASSFPKLSFRNRSIRIHVPGAAGNDLRVAIYNIAGKRILERSLSQAMPGFYNIQIPKGISQGCYLAHVRNAGRSSVSRLMVLK